MEIRFLKTFLAIVETGSFVKGAQVVNCTPSTVTFQIQTLENELKCKLFEKEGRKMVLTSKGKEIVPFIKAIYEKFSELKEVCSEPSLMKGEMFIAVPESLLTYKLQPAIRKFRTMAPEVQLHFEILNCYDIRDRVQAGEFDIGIHYDVASYGPNIVKVPLETYPLVLVGSPEIQFKNLFLKKNTSIPYAVVTNDLRSRYYKIFNSYLAKNKLKVPEVLTIHGMEAAKRCAESNLGVLFSPKFLVQSSIDQGTLIELPVQIPQAEISSILVFHQKRVMTAPKTLFIQLVKEVFGHGLNV